MTNLSQHVTLEGGCIKCILKYQAIKLCKKVKGWQAAIVNCTVTSCQKLIQISGRHNPHKKYQNEKNGGWVDVVCDTPESVLTIRGHAVLPNNQLKVLLRTILYSFRKNDDTEWGLGIILKYILAKTICQKGWVQEGHKVGGIAT